VYSLLQPSSKILKSAFPLKTIPLPTVVPSELVILKTISQYVVELVSFKGFPAVLIFTCLVKSLYPVITYAVSKVT
jgi:hypothetical protein